MEGESQAQESVFGEQLKTLREKRGFCGGVPSQRRKNPPISFKKHFGAQDAALHDYIAFACFSAISPITGTFHIWPPFAFNSIRIHSTNEPIASTNQSSAITR